MKHLIGIDEAGRGPLAGPVAVGVAKITTDFDWSLLPAVTDSKQLSSKQRATIFAEAKRLRREQRLDFTVSMVSARVIDQIGIVAAIEQALKRAIKRLELEPTEVLMKLDGGLKAPKEYKQETIIKGDQKEKIIGLASICAKETRDTYMVRESTQSIFAPYDFATHKGYGTEAHRTAIREHGASVEHRISYCKNCI